MDFSLFPTSIRTVISALQIVRFAADMRVEQKQKIISAIHFLHSFRKPPSAALYLPHLPPNAPYFVSRETQPSLIPTTNRHPPFSSNTPLPTQTALYTREAAAPSASASSLRRRPSGQLFQTGICRQTIHSAGGTVLRFRVSRETHPPLSDRTPFAFRQPFAQTFLP